MSIDFFFPFSFHFILIFSPPPKGPFVKRRHLLSYLEGDMMIMKFIHHSQEKIVGTGLDNATVATSFRDAALFNDENAATAQSLEDDLNHASPLCRARLSSLSRTTWWESSAERVVLEHDWSCGLALLSLRSVSHAGVTRKDTEHLHHHTEHHHKKVVRDDGRMDDGRVDQGSEGSEGEEDDEEVVNIEFVGCSYLDCVGAVDHMMMLESFYNYFEIEASDRAKLIGEKIEEKNIFVLAVSVLSNIYIL